MPLFIDNKNNQGKIALVDLEESVTYTDEFICKSLISTFPYHFKEIMNTANSIKKLEFNEKISKEIETHAQVAKDKFDAVYKIPKKFADSHPKPFVPGDIEKSYKNLKEEDKSNIKKQLMKEQTELSNDFESENRDLKEISEEDFKEGITLLLTHLKKEFYNENEKESYDLKDRIMYFRSKEINKITGLQAHIEKIWKIKEEDKKENPVTTWKKTVFIKAFLNALEKMGHIANFNYIYVSQNPHFCVKV